MKITMKNYQAVLEARVNWEPTRAERVFGVSAIKRVAEMPFLEAVNIKRLLDARSNYSNALRAGDREAIRETKEVYYELEQRLWENENKF